jgi:hypothetical protein
MFTPKKRTVKPGEAFQNTAIKPTGFEIVKPLTGCREAALQSSLICKTGTTNRFVISS